MKRVVELLMCNITPLIHFFHISFLSLLMHIILSGNGHRVSRFVGCGVDSFVDCVVANILRWIARSIIS